ncbi:MAG: hypothetical protein QM820_65075 [Minicystis sp.]
MRGGRQTPSTQWPVVQSASAAQPSPTEQGPQRPPQSTSVSSPFSVWSAQLGAHFSP